MVEFVDQIQRRRPSLRTAHVIEATQLATSATTLFTVPADADFDIQHFWVANTTGGAVNLTVYLVPSGGAAGAGNAVAFQVTIAANSHSVVGPIVGQRLTPGSTLQALASSVTSLNVGGWGYAVRGED